MMAAARVDNRPRRLLHPKACAWHAKLPREISSTKAREKQATFFEKGENWEKHSFLEVKNATMWIGVCQPSLGESFGWKLPNCNAGYQFL